MDNTTLFTQLTAFFDVARKDGFRRQIAYERLQNITTLNPALLNNPLIFYRDPITGALQNDVSGDSSPAIITLQACKAISGPGIFGLYPDAAARLLTWLAPVILLVTNLQYAPIGSKRFAMIPHLFSDPIDSNWSLLSKVETGNRCLAMASELYQDASDKEKVQNVGLIIFAIEELFRQVKPRCGVDFEAGQDADDRSEIERLESGLRNSGTDKVGIRMIPRPSAASNVVTPSIQARTSLHSRKFSIEQTPFCSCGHAEFNSLCEETACDILDTRTSGTLSTIFAIGVYIVLGILAAFIPEFGGNPSPSGGKIATSILLSWLLPGILQSNMVGQWTSERACYDAVMRFKERLEDLERQRPHEGECDGSRARRWTREMDGCEWKAYSKTLAETGSIYSFRLSKRFPDHTSSSSSRPSGPYILNANMASTATRVRNHWKLIILSIVPVFTSFAAAFIVLWSPPTYFSCRHAMIICILASWLFSTLFTSAVSRLGLSPKFAFNIILVKDTVLSSVILGLLISSANGLFNSCWCWSGWWYLSIFSSDIEPKVQLNPDEAFLKNNKWIYPVVVGLTLGAQLLWFLFILWMGRGVHFGMMKRHEGWAWDVAQRRRRLRIGGRNGSWKDDAILRWSTGGGFY